MHGVGSSVVNALSDRLEATIHKNGKIYRQRYEKGVPCGDVEVIGESDKNGTSVSFKADNTVFEVEEYIEATEIARMRRGAYLTPGVTFTIINEKTGFKKRFCYEGGIKTWLNAVV